MLGKPWRGTLHPLGAHPAASDCRQSKILGTTLLVAVHPFMCSQRGVCSIVAFMIRVCTRRVTCPSLHWSAHPVHTCSCGSAAAWTVTAHCQVVSVSLNLGTTVLACLVPFFRVCVSAFLQETVAWTLNSTQRAYNTVTP